MPVTGARLGKNRAQSLRTASDDRLSACPRMEPPRRARVLGPVTVERQEVVTLVIARQFAQAIPITSMQARLALRTWNLFA